MSVDAKLIMPANYNRVWTTMNDLEMVTSKICSAREIIDNAVDKIQGHEYDKAELLMTAAYEFLEYYLQEFDDKFKLAWQATVGDLRNGNVKEEFLQYTDEELNAMCDQAELDAEVERIRKEGGYDWTPEVSKKKWILPVEEVKDTDTDETEYFLSFPQDLLEAAKLNEGDEVEWVDNNDGTYTIRKV